MGKPTTVMELVSISEFIGYEKADPGELKHLSTGGRESKCDAGSSGERNGISPNQEACLLGF